MAPPNRKLSLPASILHELDTHEPASRTGDRGHGRGRQQLSRKEQRKEARVQKRQSRSSGSQLRRATPKQPSKQTPKQTQPPPRGRSRDHEFDEPDVDDDEEDEDDDEDDDDVEDDAGELDLDAGSEEDSDQVTMPERKKVVTEDDREIAALERKLGMKGKNSLPKSFEEDGLGDLLDGLDDEPAAPSRTKRKAEGDDEWLAQKRRKAQAAATANTQDLSSGGEGGGFDSDDDTSGLDDEEDGDMDVDNDSDEDDDEDDDDDGFGGFSGTDDEVAEPAKRQRENPYVAPTTGIAKYVPPSLRKQAGSDSDAEAQLRKRVQGLINRLTLDSMIGIVKDVMALYDTNPRQTVTSTLVDLVLALVYSTLNQPDIFFTTVAGFVAAIHRAMGTAVSAFFVQQLVEVFEKHHKAAAGNLSDAGSKHLIALLAELYNMQVIGCNLVFDYIRVFLEDLSELNTDLLLRIIQLCGPSLRRDDPHALQDIVHRSGSGKHVSVRTSFMIDEMKKLQSNKTKAAARNKDIAEQRTQIRKRIGALGGKQDVQPLRVGLKDIQNSDKQGKWWLVGASWSGNQSSVPLKQQDEADEVMIQVEDDLGIPDLWQLAREQGFNTEVRQRIFVAIHAATDYENADLLIRKLKLNKHQRKEIPEVIVRSGERQTVYNHYYTLVASKFTGDGRLGFQFRRALTIRFKKMGEDIDTGDGDDMDEEDESGDYELRWLCNTAKMYGSLVASRDMKLVDIVKYRNLGALQEKAHMFVEVVLITILQECKGDALGGVFGGLDADVGRGVQYFLKKHVRKTNLLKDKKEQRALKKSCDAAMETLSSSLAAKALQ
ncbi:Uu.00g138120.m01.CDS01 [Anthostomella pinea]|uniref:Uu.00g138120.m01.CDS01 n=1 Tax=Anthostomella pinea TaxID=933095 RepID=A0AAI8VPL9_9PEZI|nr:Uu.00g138120.m01.CDS01 [Anthostomella pinea]